MMLFLNQKNIESVTSYFKNDSSFNYESDFVIEIPNINLKTIIKKADDDFKNLNSNLVYYKNKDYENKIIVFGHSGMGYGTYFNRLNELEIGNKAYLHINKLKITYVVTQKYMVLETDTSILNDNKERTLLLVTCDKNNKKKRLIVELRVKNIKTLKK